MNSFLFKTLLMKLLKYHLVNVNHLNLLNNIIYIMFSLVLFDLYDFNELNSLSLVDLEFMFISCCNATSKIYCLNQEVDEDDVSRFLNNYFTDESRINISQLLKWCTKISEIKEFFNIIRKEQPSTKTQSGINAGAKTVFEAVNYYKLSFKLKSSFIFHID